MLYLFLGCSTVMIHEVPDTKNGGVESLLYEEKEEVLPVKGPDLKLYNIRARYLKMPKQVYSGGHNINVRNEATILSDVVAKLPLGHPITVLSSTKESTIGDRTDLWYHVESRIGGKAVQGYLFGTNLTPHVIRSDFDMDGVEEQILAVYNNNFEVLFRIYDPNGAAKTLWSNLGKYEQGENIAKQMVLRLYPKEVIGRPMIRLDVSCPDACEGKSWTKFVSYYEGKLLRALEYESQEVGSSYKTVELDFNPLSHNVILSRIEGRQLADGIFEQVRLAEMWKLYGGVFRLQSSAPPLTEHLPPPSILMEEKGSWLVGDPVAEDLVAQDLVAESPASDSPKSPSSEEVLEEAPSLEIQTREDPPDASEPEEVVGNESEPEPELRAEAKEDDPPVKSVNAEGSTTVETPEETREPE